jgi:inorganic pyrophosphatase
MSICSIDLGENSPYEVNVIIEIPSHSDPVKYEVDKATGALKVDRFLSTSMRYPCNYGYVPCTLSNDGDPVDVLVIAPYPVISGAVIKARPVGMLKMTDEAGVDAKVLAVPVDKLSRDYQHIKTVDDLPKSQLDTIAHFFEHYKDLEPNKWVKIEGWLGPEAAHEEILASVKRYRKV